MKNIRPLEMKIRIIQSKQMLRNFCRDLEELRRAFGADYEFDYTDLEAAQQTMGSYLKNIEALLERNYRDRN